MDNKANCNLENESNEITAVSKENVALDVDPSLEDKSVQREHHKSHHHSSHHDHHSHHSSHCHDKKKHRRPNSKKKKMNLSPTNLLLILSAVIIAVLLLLAIWLVRKDTPPINNSSTNTNYEKNANINYTESKASIKNDIITWDKPIFDANIPVFQLSEEKTAIANKEYTSNDIYAMYDALRAKHPEYITKTDLGVCSDGINHVYRYDFREPSPYVDTSGKHKWSETKSKAIIISGIHWEWGGIFALYYALEEIAENPDLKDFRRNTHLIVIPVSNPYAIEHQGVRNANQVEIHRNFEVDFIYPGEDGYVEIGERSHGGTSPLSEIETQYIDNILKNNTDAAFFLSCHSFQQDTVWGTGFVWHSPATYYMCNMGYRVIDKLTNAWMTKYGDVLHTGINEYKTSNLDDGDVCLGFGRLSTTNGTETKQATKYGIQGINLEICDTFWVHGTKDDPEEPMSSFTMSRGAEVYVNFLLTAFGVYDSNDKLLYQAG